MSHTDTMYDNTSHFSLRVQKGAEICGNLLSFIVFPWVQIVYQTFSIGVRVGTFYGDIRVLKP